MKTVGFWRMKQTDSGWKLTEMKLVGNHFLYVRGRYLQVSKLEDCRRWRIVLLCRLIGSTDDNSQEEKFVRLNLFFQALQQPVGDSSMWIQWGVLQVLTVILSRHQLGYKTIISEDLSLQKN